MTNPAPSREERLAAKLRENLRRRKTQAREHSGAQKAAPPNTAPPNTALKEQHPALPKTPPES